MSKDPSIIVHAAEALCAFLTGPMPTGEPPWEDKSPAARATDRLNSVIETLNRQLRDRFGGAAAAIELDDRKPTEGGRMLVYWDGLYSVAGRGGSNHHHQYVLQPILNSPLVVRMALPELLPDLILQLEEEA